MENLVNCSDDQLLETIDRLAVEERKALPQFLGILGELDRRGLAIKKGYSSTFDFCVRRLKLSEDEAYRRIRAARASVLRPGLLSSLENGALSLTAVTRIAPHVRRDDAEEIISHAEGKTAKEVEDLLAPFSPEPAKRDRIRTISVRQKMDEPSAPSKALNRVEFSFQGSMALRESISRAQELLSNKFPFGGLEDVLSEIVQEYLDHHDPQRSLALGKVVRPKGGSAIPAASRRAVWARDRGRCTFTGPGGVRCETRRTLEIDHVKPRALGGSDESENLRLLCRAHNDSERRRVLGESS